MEGLIIFIVLMSFGAALIIASTVLLAVWVYKDAKLREMDSPGLWVLVVLFVSNLIGLIIYLIIRPKYKTMVCPNCGYRGQSFRYCVHCGAENQYSFEPYKSNYKMMILSFIFVVVSIFSMVGGAIGLIVSEGYWDRWTVLNGVENNYGNNWSMSFKQLDGSKTKTYTAKNDSSQFVYTCAITSGTFKIELFDNNGNLLEVLFNTSNDDAKSGVVTGLTKSEKYKVKITGEYAKGSFSVNLT